MNLIPTKIKTDKQLNQTEKIKFTRELSRIVGGYVWSSETFDGEYLSKRYALESIAISRLGLYKEEMKWLSDSVLEHCLRDKGVVVEFEELTWGR